jgi:hypothetical protein
MALQAHLASLMELLVHPALFQALWTVLQAQLVFCRALSPALLMTWSLRSLQASLILLFLALLDHQALFQVLSQALPTMSLVQL